MPAPAVRHLGKREGALQRAQAVKACWGLLPSGLAAWLQVLSFAGELLAHAESLLRDGLHTSEVADGYGKACAKVSVSLLPTRGGLHLVSDVFVGLPCNAAPAGPQSCCCAAGSLSA